MAEETRGRILLGAIDLLQRTGSGDFTMEQLADWIGVSRKTIYNHFTSRTELINDAITDGMERIVGRLAAIADDSTLGFVDKLDRIVEHGFRETHRLWEPLGTPGKPPAPMSVLTTVQEVNRRLREVIDRIVAEAAESGYLDKRIDRTRFPHVVMNVINGIRTTENADSLPCTHLELLQESLKTLLVGALSEHGHRSLRNATILADPARPGSTQ